MITFIARPTMKQYEKALKAAGLPTDSSKWSAEQVKQASAVLDECHADKLAKWLVK